jgi:microcystin degradation protein MlrC
MRILLGGVFHETHCFVDGTTPLAEFEIRRGAELLACEGDASPFGGVLEFARKSGWTMLPTVDFRASPSALVEDEVVETWWREFRERAEPELARGVDGIYLVLHGAMTSESHPDVEGELLERLRKLRGAGRAPVFGVFDLHANFTQRMATHANCLVAYRENPHTDARESAVRAAALLDRCLRTGEVPQMFWQHPPLIWPPTGTGTQTEPMLTLEAMARRLEKGNASLWTVNVAAGFAFADTPDTGVSFCLATTQREAVARAALSGLSNHALKHRDAGNVTDPPLDAVMKEVMPLRDGLTVLVEPSDNIGGGAPGDGTGILRALVSHRVPNCAVCLNDPEAVARLATKRIGSTHTLELGGKGSRLDAGPLELKVKLVSRRAGRFELEDKNSHLASMCGNAFDMGPCAVVRHEGVTILLTSRRTPPFDLGQWRSQGIEPTKLSVIGVKAAMAHRRAYDKIASRMLWVDTPGPCSSNLKTLPFHKVKRPVFPLDELRERHKGARR